MPDDLEEDRLKRLGMQLAIDCAGDDIPPTTAEMVKRRRTDKRTAQANVDEHRREVQQFAPNSEFNGRLFQQPAGRAEE